MREQIYKTVHIYEGRAASVAYKWFMILTITASLIPLVTKKTGGVLYIIDCVCLGIYIIDFTLRWITADYKFGESGVLPFVKYPIRIISLVDILSIVALTSSVFGIFSAYGNIAATLKVFRVVRLFRYSKSIRTIMGILKRSKRPLAAVGGLAVGYIAVSALIVFNVEPDTFDTFFDALYWATVSLTTVGYGDIYPVTVVGRVVAMVSSFFGIAVVALPAGIVTAEYMKTVQCDCDDMDGDKNKRS